MKPLSMHSRLEDVLFKEPDENYFVRSEISNSDMGCIEKFSYFHWKYWKQNPLEATPALNFGKWTHQCLLEYDLFKEQVVVGPDCDKRNKEWKACEIANPGRTIIEPATLERILGIRDAVMNHPTANRLVRESLKERVGVWYDEEYEVACRMKIDGVLESEKIVWDLKTTDCAKPESFAKSVKNYGYARQNAFYLRGLEQLGFPMEAAMNIVVEKTEPYGVMVYVTEDDVLEQGRREVAKALKHYSHCLKSNTCPSYPIEIQPLPFPAWGFTA